MHGALRSALRRTSGDGAHTLASLAFRVQMKNGALN